LLHNHTLTKATHKSKFCVLIDVCRKKKKRKEKKGKKKKRKMSTQALGLPSLVAEHIDSQLQSADLIGLAVACEPQRYVSGVRLTGSCFVVPRLVHDRMQTLTIGWAPFDTSFHYHALGPSFTTIYELVDVAGLIPEMNEWSDEIGDQYTQYRFDSPRVPEFWVGVTVDWKRKRAVLKGRGFPYNGLVGEWDTERKRFVWPKPNATLEIDDPLF
jgi:hypothetical protein